jgi:hypothetical protein
MWYAVTANPLNRKKKEIKKEFYSKECEIFLSAITKSDLEDKIRLSIKKFPKEAKKYIDAGLKLVEANTSEKAKRLATKTEIYIEENGQLKFF